MKFLLETWSAGARAGLLMFGELQLETPCLLMVTKKGLPAHITHDLLENVLPDAGALQISPIHFLESPPPSIVASVGGVHKLLSLQRRVVVGIARDSFGQEADGLNGTKFGAAFETSSGRRVVGPKKYMEAINALRPDLWATLPDEVPAWATTKRHRMSVDRTLRWLDDCLTLNAVQDNSVLGVVVGGSNVEERKRSAEATARRNVSGFSLGGFGLGEIPQERAALLKSTIAYLPEEKVRHVSGLGMPEEVLEGVAAGIDLFDSTYPHSLTMKGFAMTFPLWMEQQNGYHPLSEEEHAADMDLTKIDLHSAVHRCDVNPIVKGCKCYSCRKHTRAYIHHLLNVHEMLAQTLLDIHNYHHYFSFFRAIRTSIAMNKFQAFREWFMSRRRYIAGADAISSKQSDDLLVAKNVINHQIST
ncbi:queuine tRNA-ribosyltransferase accessory subunit [Marchantia polymorpha subsp. ruderalis]|uniref:Queuine tRNA-ribosyltransferase accessory subunit 2 n=2 Tax=Marchantia polymorpha TaxID=3197 RepID=A0AAF6BUT2_MARPO|nr:hypothetical protein MARPO_0046s0064 [Marchantia polymorpha]BBN15766.1 hypothetical protein Mp_7g00610 [Marchantia polymorpha subsp. ruderalis]|eukprot:PTQ39242.1 hypothetical protein MARPO_0046s0064 [Marchantia polymorpha]